MFLEDSSGRLFMAAGLTSFRGRVLLITSGRDLTAQEFNDAAHSNRRLSEVLKRGQVERVDLQAADHTFSSAAMRAEVTTLTVDWMGSK